MQPSVRSDESDMRAHGETYESCKAKLAKLDLAYMKLGVIYHRIRPELRAQLAPNRDDGEYHEAFEYDEDKGLPYIIEQIRALDADVRTFGKLLRRGENSQDLLIAAGNSVRQAEEIGMAIDDLRWDQKPLRDLVLLRGETDVFVAGRGLECFNNMDERRRYRFLRWARELTEMQAAEKLGLGDGFRYVIDLVLGGEDRIIIELPEDFYPEDQGLL